MGPVPANFKLDSFIGRQLNQICIGCHDMLFRFDSGYDILCYGDVVVELNGKSSVVFDTDAQTDMRIWPDITPLPLLAGREAVSWCVEGSHEFSITLTGEARVRFQSNDRPYEDFVILPDLQVV